MIDDLRRHDSSLEDDARTALPKYLLDLHLLVEEGEPALPYPPVE